MYRYLGGQLSRTKKGKKSPGWDYWGKRPLGFGDSGTKGKRIGLKKERALAKQKLIKIKKEKEDV
jgi:hypothetical protein